MTIMKASQIGISELALVLMITLAAQGVAGIYVLPTNDMRSTFVPNRIDKVIEAVPLYRSHCGALNKDVDSRIMKSLFGKAWKFVGANSIKNFYEFPAGAIFIDERDLCNEENITYARDRLGASAHPIIRRFGNPTIANRGIDADFEKTDQRRWHIKCPHCNHWQHPTWFDNVIEQTGTITYRVRDSLCDVMGARLDHTAADIAVVCSACAKPIDRLAQGEWIAKYPERQKRGYHASRIFGDARVDRACMREMYEHWLDAIYNPFERQRFYNNVLGIPFDAPGSHISEQMMDECILPEYKMPLSAASTSAGCDVGGVLHLVIDKNVDGERVPVFIGTVQTFEELHSVCERYGVIIGVIDAMPETHKAREFVEAHPGWYLNSYFPSDKVADFTIDNKKQTVSIDRTQSLDASYSEYARKSRRLPVDYRYADDGRFVDQMTAPVRVLEEKPGHQPRYVWDEGKKADHYRHADNYASIASRIMGGGGSMVAFV